jgi:hypothetical protein
MRTTIATTSTRLSRHDAHHSLCLTFEQAIDWDRFKLLEIGALQVR